jgi:molybdopterin-guanine dinucleotide biosynthesis protein A
MGRDKAFLPFKGKPLVQNVHDILAPHFDEILLSAGDPGKFAFLKARVVQDEEKSRGPLMAIYSAIGVSSSEINFVIACDIPEIHVPFMLKLLDHAAGYDAVIACTGEGKNEALFAVYRKSLRGVMKEILDEGKNKISFLFDRCRVKYIRMEDSGWYKNINTEEDYRKL